LSDGEQSQTSYPHEKTGNTISNSDNQQDSSAFREQTDKKEADVWLNSSQPNLSDGVESDRTIPPDGDSDKAQVSKSIRKCPRALLLSVGYACDCGRLYQTNFKKSTIVVQKENMFFEHVDFRVHTFLVHCDKCDNDREFSVNNLEAEDGMMSILCSRCSPNRKGLLDVHTGEVTWL
jgi:hypothetical protein